jgi:hypothetical protein
MWPKRWWALLLVVGLVVLTGWLTASPVGVNARNAVRLSRGMSENNVEAVLGSPGTATDASLDWYTKEWVEAGTTIRVVFGRDNRCIMSAGLRRQTSEGVEQFGLTEGGNGESLGFFDKCRLWIGF